jgi:hypothetical protein
VVNLELSTQSLRHRRQALSRTQPGRAFDVRRQVAVAEAKPRLSIELFQSAHEVPGFTGDSPSLEWDR